jgi:transketolase
MTLQELASLLQPRQAIRAPAAPHPVIVGATQPSVARTSGEPAKDAGKIVVKQTVKQIVGPRKRRKTKADAGNKAALKAKKVEYAAMKNQVRKRLSAEKKAAFQKALAEAKTLPAKERKSRIAAIRKEHKEKLAALLKQMPALGKRKMNEIIGLLKRIKQIRW